MIQKVKELRVRIDGLGQLTKGLECSKYDPTREGHVQWRSQQVDKTIDSLFLVKEWLGEVLVELGIEPTADVNETPNTDRGIPAYRNMSHIQKVDWLRQEISKSINILKSPLFARFYSEEFSKIHKYIEKKYPRGTPHDYKKVDVELRELQDKIPDVDTSVIFALQHLSEARFWLESELSRIRKTSKD